MKTFKTQLPASSFPPNQEVQNSAKNVIENLKREIGYLNDALEKSEANLRISKDTCGVLEEKIDK